MTVAELSLCHSRALAAASRLRLPLSSKVWRGQAGEFSGTGSGSSLDFQDHRAYSPGDDPRHINWQAYARTGSYTMKLFREEVRPVVDLFLDASESMFFDPAKAARTAEIFYLVCESCIASGASLAIHAIRGDASLTIDPAAVRSHQWLAHARALSPKDASAPPALSAVPIRANSIRILLSDLLFPGDPEPILRHLTQRHGSIVVFAPFLESEANPGWSGNYEFTDPETSMRHPHRVDPDMLRRYLSAYANHFTLWKQHARRHQASFARIPASEDIAAAMFRAAVPAGALEATR